MMLTATLTRTVATRSVPKSSAQIGGEKMLSKGRLLFGRGRYGRFRSYACVGIRARAGTQVDPLVDIERRLLWLQGCRAMVKIAERGARRRIHRHRQSLSGNNGGDEGRDGWQWRDRLHRRYRHDRSSMAAKAASRNYKPGKGKLVHTWYAYPMESFMAVPAEKAGNSNA